MNVSLPDELKQFVDSQVNTRSYSSASEYVRELIRLAQDREELRARILAGADSPIATDAEQLIAALRSRRDQT